MADKRSVDDLSLEELESILRRRKRDVQEERLRRLRASGRARGDLPLPEIGPRASGGAAGVAAPPPRAWFNRLLLAVELGALLGFIFVIYLLFAAIQETNAGVPTPLAGLPSPTSPALIDLVLLPSGHTPPDPAGKTTPNEAGAIPEHLQVAAAAVTPPPLPTSGPEQPRLIEIPAIHVRHPVVAGDGWEQLKLGVGHHVGSANPGQRGNMVLTAHNDVFGEIFRDLNKLAPGDLIYVETASRRFTYVVATSPRVVAPTEVSVLLPTRDATTTLITCHPYLIDTQRLVVVATLKP